MEPKKGLIYKVTYNVTFSTCNTPKFSVKIRKGVKRKFIGENLTKREGDMFENLYRGI